ncbi:MAG: domain S-box/diguanylate cyclase protein [Conexibacter sp.]|nr:domain S-box/diguanylate cyclase protein [Conexibacter sp.]
MPTKPDETEIAGYIEQLLETGERSQEIVLQEIARAVSAHFASGALLLFLTPDHQTVLTAGADHPDPAIRGKLWHYRDVAVDSGESPVMQRMLKGETVRMVTSTPQEFAELVRPSLRPRVIDAAIHSVLSAPLQAGGITYGALCLYRHGDEPSFTAEEEARLAELCIGVAPKIDRDRVVRALMDESARVPARQAMFEATERFRTIFEHASIGMALFSIEDGRPGRLIEVNPQLCEIMGMLAEELLGRRTGSFDHPANVGVGSDQVHRLLAGGCPVVTFEKRLVRGDGREITAHQQITVVRLPDGRTPYGITLLADVTDRRRTEAELVRSEALTRGIRDAALDAIVTIDVAGVIVDANPAAERVLGWTREQLVGRLLAETAVPPEARDAHTNALRRLADAGGDAAPVARRLELEALRADGTRFPAELSISSIAGDPPLYTGHLRDITDRISAHEQLARRISQQRTVAALQRRALQGASRAALKEAAVEAVRVNLPADQAAVLEVRDGALVAIALTAGAPWPLESLTTGPRVTLPDDLLTRPRTFSETPADDELPLPDHWRQLGVRGATIAAIARRDEGDVAILAALNTRGRGEYDDFDRDCLQAMAGVLASAAQRAAAEDELRHRTLHDQLTGLPNRTLFRDRLEQATERAAREGMMVAVMLLDVDRFKNVNDAVGHLAGDDLLRGVARRLAGAARPGDTIARFGGDEFALLAEGVDGEREAIAIAQALLGALDEPLTVHDRTVAVQLSIGVAVSADPGGDAPDSLIRDAGVALSAAKDGGGGRLQLFESRMRRNLLHRVQLEEELRQALERDELTLAFQPVVDVRGRQIASLEALLRWEHPQSGVVLPAEFLGVAETSGLAVPIGRYVLTTVCRQVARWCADPALQVPEVSINVSARQLAEPGFVEEVGGVLRRTGVPAGQIAFELKETELLDDESAAPTSALQGLRDLGIRVVLDDFGTGWSSLSDLKRFPIAGVKIDPALIRGLTDGDEQRHIVRAVTGLAEALGLSVVAKGVETPGVALAATRLGCTLAQGFLFARPLAAAATEALLREGPDRLIIADELVDAARARPPAAAVDEPSPAAPAADEPTMALSDAAEALGVSASTLRRWADSGRLGVVRTAGGHRRFSAGDVRRLRRETDGRDGPALRPARLPDGPILELSVLLLEEGPALARRAVALLYEPGREGWFAGEAGDRHLESWLGAMRAGAAGTVPWNSMIDATRELAMRAGHGGAAQVEGHVLLERFGDLLQFRLGERGASQATLVQARRLLRMLHRVIVDADRDA